MRIRAALTALLVCLAGCVTPIVGADVADLQDQVGPAETTTTDQSAPADATADTEQAPDLVDLQTPSDVGESDQLADQLDTTLEDAPDVVACLTPPCPTVITSFPFIDTQNTSNSTLSSFNAYSCAAGTNESGPEVVYQFTLQGAGTIVASVQDGAGVDIDLHLLTANDSQTCLTRNDKAISWHLDPGTYYLVADTYVSAQGAQAGEYTLRAYFIADSSKCAMKSELLARIGANEPLQMPATGQVVQEAHLVTKEEAEGQKGYAGDWPSCPVPAEQYSCKDGISTHYSVTNAVSGFDSTQFQLSQPWAPCCEPSNNFGQGSSSKPPAAAEAWYINMRWTGANSPTPGKRYLVFNPFTGGAIVAAAGYENGPGDVSRIGGASEEIHMTLGTTHLSTLTFGEMTNGQALPYGPINCFE